jgi:hypothetical protein
LDINQFRAKVYQELTKHGMTEIAGVMYFPEPAIMDALEFIYHEVRNIPIDSFEMKIVEATTRALRRLQDLDSQGLADENENGCDCEGADFFEDDPF